MNESVALNRNSDVLSPDEIQKLICLNTARKKLFNKLFYYSFTLYLAIVYVIGSMKHFLSILFIFIFSLNLVSPLLAQDTIQEPIPVLTLGIFHFDFPNLDRIQYNNNEIIDVSEPKYQAEIEKLVNALSEFSPTIIVIERPVEMQNKIDSLFQLYQTGKYALQKGEYEQIGFRLAQKLCINRIYCVDEWGKHYENIEELLKDENSESYIRFEDSFIHHSDSTKGYYPKPVFQKQGIISELILLNKPENIRRSLGNYLIGHFKYEANVYDFIGTDFETGRWFNRNLRIFRNIQRIMTKPKDRILVIFGADHMNILNYLFECSPEYNLQEIYEYLSTGE